MFEFALTLLISLPTVVHMADALATSSLAILAAIAEQLGQHLPH